MRILLVSDIANTHTQKWIHALVAKGCTLGVFSLAPSKHELPNGVVVKTLDFGRDFTMDKSRDFSKAKYLKALPKLKTFIQEFKPDILHSHYASSYGLLGSLSEFHPFVLSVWGSDVYQFPRKSFVHKALFKFNLKRADAILSTSETMKKETQKYTSKNISVTPFGIDVKHFKAIDKVAKGKFVIGTVKALEVVYGIDILIRSFTELLKSNPGKDLELRIVGDGSQEENLKKLCVKLGVENLVKFLGRIPHKDLPAMINEFNVFVALSREESFGVAILEAGACEVPVVVSDVGGLPEVVKDGVTGIVVPAENSDAAAQAIERLMLNESLSTNMGKKAREHVLVNYDWDNNVNQMIKIYADLT